MIVTLSDVIIVGGKESVNHDFTCSRGGVYGFSQRFDDEIPKFLASVHPEMFLNCWVARRGSFSLSGEPLPNPPFEE